jgi:hypothetical protein
MPWVDMVVLGVMVSLGSNVCDGVGVTAGSTTSWGSGGYTMHVGMKKGNLGPA